MERAEVLKRLLELNLVRRARGVSRRTAATMAISGVITSPSSADMLIWTSFRTPSPCG